MKFVLGKQFNRMAFSHPVIELNKSGSSVMQICCSNRVFYKGLKNEADIRVANDRSR